jgi:hypothetical protein
MTKMPSKLDWLRRSVRWLFGSAFRRLPPEFGDPVPPELRVFAAEAEEIQHRVHEEDLSPSSMSSRKTTSVRRDGTLGPR